MLATNRRITENLDHFIIGSEDIFLGLYGLSNILGVDQGELESAMKELQCQGEDLHGKGVPVYYLEDIGRCIRYLATGKKPNHFAQELVLSFCIVGIQEWVAGIIRENRIQLDQSIELTVLLSEHPEMSDELRSSLETLLQSWD